jgi:hypothetical protein
VHEIPDDRSQRADSVLTSEPLPVKTPVDGECPECGARELRQYPVLAAGGWFDVTKCQRCLASVSRTRWHRLGWIHLPEDEL